MEIFPAESEVTIKRTDLVVPANLIAGLRIPELAVTDGSAEPEWADVPMSSWRFRRRPSQRLPLDRASAKRVRRYLRLAPWSALVGIIPLASLTVVVLSARVNMVLVVLGSVISVGWNFTQPHRLPDQTPSRGYNGDLRIPQVPEEVAQEWVAANPGVFVTDEPAPRAHPPRFYGIWAAVQLVAAFALATVLSEDGRENSFLLWLPVPVLFISGIMAAYKIQPPAKPA